jgi:hypothetical protein
MGKVENAKGNNEEGLNHLNKALIIAEGADFVEPLIQLYDQLAKIYNEKLDYEKTSFYLSKYVKLKDSIYSEELIKNLAKVQTNYAERENLKALALNAQLIQKQKSQTVFIAVIALLLLILAGVFYKNYRDKLLANQKLDERVRERTEQLRATNQQLAHALDRQVLLAGQLTKDGQGILASINGLCHVALLDLHDEKAKAYIRKVTENTMQLVEVMERFRV